MNQHTITIKNTGAMPADVLQHIQSPLERRRGEKADRRVLAQNQEIRRLALLAHRLEMVHQVQSEANQEDKFGKRQLFDLAELDEKIQYTKSLSSDGAESLRKCFAKLDKLGPWRPVVKAPDPKILDALDKNYPNFGQVTALLRRRLHLCRCAPEQLLKLPPILLDGPAGVGKTAYCLQVAKLFGMRFEQIDLSAGATDFAMTGLDIGYSSGRPGRVWESLMHDSLSVLWLLDEVDKSSESTRHAGINFLLGLLEPVSSARFLDCSTLLPVNASWICYFATSNHLEAIPMPLRSRFEVCAIATPDAHQMKAVVRSIHSDLLLQEDWSAAFEIGIPEDAFRYLCNLTPRVIKKTLQDAYANAASDGRRALLLTDFSAAREVQTVSTQRIGFL